MWRRGGRRGGGGAGVARLSVNNMGQSKINK